MKIRKILSIILLILFAGNVMGQNNSISKANKAYDKYAYIDAIKTYEKVANKGYKNEKMFQRLGNAYYFNGELSKAGKWYGELYAMNPNQESEYDYRYSQCLKALGDYTNADKILQDFNRKASKDKRAILFEKNRNYLEEVKADSGRFVISDAGINSKYSDYGSAFWGDKLVFASSRDTDEPGNKRAKWTNQAFSNLYEVDRELKPDGSAGEIKRLNSQVNSKFNESTAIFTKDGKTMYFTRNNFLDGKKGKDAQRVTLLKIYKASLVGDKWINVVELPFNNDQYSVAHPALSVDEKTLYFASDMPGTFGQSDLFSVSINKNGSYGKPVNLGENINTEGKETFPFVSGDNELYFASDGRPGLGGLDIFVSKIDVDGSVKEVRNIGASINGSQDDFAFVINSENRSGFFSSNRDGGHGFDDIYRFKENKKCEQLLKGTVIDLATKKVLDNAKLTLFDSQFKILKEENSGVDGKFNFAVDCGKSYYLRASKEDYETSEILVTAKKSSGETIVTIELEKGVKRVGVGEDLAKTLNIPIIYFDLDKSFIRKDAAFELEKVLAVMQEYPKMKIDVRSHTDSRQSAKYNLALSDRRAKATIEWLIKNGIAPERLSGKGYGEGQLLNNCSDGVRCTEAEHQLNRRSEFIVVSLQ